MEPVSTMNSVNVNSRPFAVVFFIKENNMSIVPVTWLTLENADKGIYKCKWPKSNADAKSKAEMKPKKSWASYPATVHRFSRSYENADKYMTKLKEANSDLNITSSDDASSSQRIGSQCSEVHGSCVSPTPPILNSTPNSSHSLTAPQSIIHSRTPRPVTINDLNRLEAKVDCLLQKMSAMEVEFSLMKGKISTLQNFENISLDCRVDDFVKLSTFEEIEDFEEKLKSEEEFSKGVKRCGCLGGKDVKEAVRRIMQTIFSHSMALSMCWNKGSLKTSIQNFPNILQFIAVSLRSNRLYRGTSQKDVEDVIKRWLRYAADRNGGRMKRMKRNMSNNDDMMLTDVNKEN